MFFVQFEKLQP